MAYFKMKFFVSSVVTDLTVKLKYSEYIVFLAWKFQFSKVKNNNDTKNINDDDDDDDNFDDFDFVFAVDGYLLLFVVHYRP